MEQQQKNTGGRPVKTIKKEVIIRVRVDRQQLFVLKHKARQAGVTLSWYIRQVAMTGTVHARLTPEQMGVIRKLAGIGTNLNQLTREFKTVGMVKTAATIQEYWNKVDSLLSMLK